MPHVTDAVMPRCALYRVGSPSDGGRGSHRKSLFKEQTAEAEQCGDWGASEALRKIGAEGPMRHRPNVGLSTRGAAGR